MFRLVALTLCLGFAAGAASADSRTQLLSNVDKELRFFVPGVDASSLSTAQLAAINGIIHSDGTHSNKIGGIRSVLGGSKSLRGLLFNVEAGISSN